MHGTSAVRMEVRASASCKLQAASLCGSACDDALDDAHFVPPFRPLHLHLYIQSMLATRLSRPALSFSSPRSPVRVTSLRRSPPGGPIRASMASPRRHDQASWRKLIAPEHTSSPTAAPVGEANRSHAPPLSSNLHIWHALLTRGDSLSVQGNAASPSQLAPPLQAW
jgi:hypothetical protein